MSGIVMGRPQGYQTKFVNNKSFKTQASRSMSFSERNDNEYSKSLAETVIMGTMSDRSKFCFGRNVTKKTLHSWWNE